MNVNILKLRSNGYPSSLSQISTPPEQLFWAGVDPSSWLTKPRVGVVGSRKITPYGKAVTSKLTTELAQAGVVIVSGLAYGVDVCAHQAALAAKGTTVAILGTSLNEIYPAAHAQIARQITLHGTIFSEYPEETPGYPSNFIARNRIISGLSEVLLITEAAINSGSLHTARFALEQGKTVMAIPGNITSPFSEGCNNLIKSGAIPVTSAEDVFFALNINPLSRKLKHFRGLAHEQQVLNFIRDGVCGQEDLALATHLESPILASTLTMLEIEGYIRPIGSGNWVVA